MDPGASPGSRADLILAGSSYPVSLELRHEDGIVTLDLKSHGEALETERYQETASYFSLVDAAEEHFKPPITLLKFPFHTGDGWSWMGTMTTGQIPRQAVATVSSKPETLFESGVSRETVKVTVNLSFGTDGGGRFLNRRELVFWFAPKSGIVKRQFGTASVREPASP